MNGKKPSRRAAPDDRSAAAPPREGVKDTIESVVVAFILAFVFRAFIIEAFVIPTGSMAATLYGKHGTLTCADCGWEFAYGLTDQSSRPLPSGPNGAISAHTDVFCPNCQHANKPTKVNDRAGPGGNAEPGDRILVLKWPFDLGGALLQPGRWDVTVFKDPSKGTAGLSPRVAASAPRDGTQNYIKRLLGLPDEVLEIIDGDVYAAPVSSLSAETMATLEALRRIKYLRYRDDDPATPSSQEWKQADAGKQAMFEELNQKLRICRKTDLAQRSLWSIVYDHDYAPQTPDPQQPSWIPSPKHQDVWDTSSRKIRGNCIGRDGGQVVFSGKGGHPYITDLSGYNAQPSSRNSRIQVSDLRLELVLLIREGDGCVWLGLSKYEDTFWAKVQADGHIGLYRTDDTEPPDEATDALATARIAGRTMDRPLQVDFRNVDYRVSLTVDGQELLATTDDQFAPDLPRLRAKTGTRSGRRTSPLPRIAAQDLNVECWHVSLNRDVQYLSMGFDSSRVGQGHQGWGTTNNPIWLRDDEFFMLGDNSPASKDSRLWDSPGQHLSVRGEDYQLGTVPCDQIIGRAFFVYWPAGHRSESIPFLRNRGVIPNFGRMRWIR
ncbi:MAG: hypothetical protein GY778_20025 [bacterium]|nr:hypothetical protein [bacterium]